MNNFNEGKIILITQASDQSVPTLPLENSQILLLLTFFAHNLFPRNEQEKEI